MISDTEARRYAAKIRRGKDTPRERGDYDRWARATKGRRQRTPLAALLAERDVRARTQQATSDLLPPPNRRATIPIWKQTPAEEARGFDPVAMHAHDPKHESTLHEAKAEPPIAPPLPPLDGELVEEPIAPPIDLPEVEAPKFDLGSGIAKGARAVLEAIDKRNPEIGGLALASILGEKFWPAWEAAAERLLTKYAGPMNLADDELVVGGAVVVVAQPIAIPYVKEHAGEWLDKIKRAVGFGGAS